MCVPRVLTDEGGRGRDIKCLSEGCLYSAITTLCECRAGYKRHCRWGFTSGAHFLYYEEVAPHSTTLIPGISFFRSTGILNVYPSNIYNGKEKPLYSVVLYCTPYRFTLLFLTQSCILKTVTWNASVTYKYCVFKKPSANFRRVFIFGTYCLLFIFIYTCFFFIYCGNV